MGPQRSTNYDYNPEGKMKNCFWDQQFGHLGMRLKHSLEVNHKALKMH